MDAVEDIKSRLSIDEVASGYMELKRAGRNFKALSPFSNEKTPSFMVSPEKQIWHDFSSGKGGDMFTLVMELEGLDFKGALELLARKAGVDLSAYKGTAGQARGKTKLYDCLEAAAKFYQIQFSKNRTALEYILRERGYTKETALTFRIGYAPNTGTALGDYLLKKGFSEQHIKQAGLISTRYSRAHDMFRGRIMIPLQDATGRVIGFTARALAPDDSGPKYINTPQTPVYDKSRHAYGLHLAKESIRKRGFVVVVEGNLDVIASWQAGVANVVASAGTAMTAQHLKELARFTNDVRLAFDQDEAGLRAMERIIPLASAADISLSVITVPEGKDPDELIKRNPLAWKKAVETYEQALDWLIRLYVKKLDITSGGGKKAFTDVILPVVARLSDSVEKDHYIQTVAEIIHIDAKALRSKLSRTAKKTHAAPRIKQVRPAVVPKSEAEEIKTYNQLLALALMQPDLRTYLTYISADMLAGEAAGKLLTLLQSDSEEPVEKSSEYAKMLTVVYEELYSGLEFIELQYEAARLQTRVIERYVKHEKTALAAKMREGTALERSALQQKDKQLNELLKMSKGVQ